MSAVVTKQPRRIHPTDDEDSTEWVPESTTVLPPEYPPGLEYLTDIDQLFIHQKVEMFGENQTKNKYSIKNSLGQQCFYAYEDSELCMRICCGASREFSLHILDKTEEEVIRLTHPFKCCSGCCWCALYDDFAYRIDMEAPPGGPLGQIRQAQSCCEPRFNVLDANGKRIFKIIGPRCLCGIVSFEIYSTFDGNGPYEDLTGMIVKQFGGLEKQYFTDATNLCITFSKDLDVKLKAMLLGATFLIDMMYFEDQNQR